MKHPTPRGAAMALMAALCLSHPETGAAQTQRIEGERLVAAAQQALLQAARGSVRIEARARREPDAISVPTGQLELQAQPDTGSWASAMRVVVSARVDGQLVRRVPVWLSVQAHADAPVAAHDLPIGQRLGEGDLRTAAVDLAALQVAQPDSTASLVGKRLKRAVAQGQPVIARLAEDPPEVVRGARVVVELDSDGIAVAAPGVALADARLGQTVRVRMPRDAVLVATVTGLQRARINPEEATP